MDKEIEYQSFISAVKDMRDLQARYQETHDPRVLTDTKKAERVVDRLLKSIF